MKEHKIILQMVALVKKELKRLEKYELDPAFIDASVDFFRTYADKCHHGKEEDILFKRLSSKKISAEHKKMMDQLIKEHKLGRKNVKALLDAKNRYIKGDKKALNDVKSNLSMLSKFYPIHIEKEDKHFFIPVMKYFSKKEQDTMLKQFWDFDKDMIHKKYVSLVLSLKK